MKQIALGLLLILPAQEKAPVRVTLSESGSFSALVRELSTQCGVTIAIDPSVDDKQIKVSVREATVLQALDALCRAHKGATYLGGANAWPPPRHLTLRAGDWVDYPSVTAGEFKILLDGWQRTKEITDAGADETQRLSLSALAPPNLRILLNGKETWSFSSIKDGKDNDLLLKESSEADGWDRTRLPLKTIGRHVGISRAVRVRPFDKDAGLKLIEGVLEADVVELEDVTISLDAGKETATALGTFVVSSSTPVKGSSRPETRVTLSLKEGTSLADAFEGFGTTDKAEDRWDYVNPTIKGAIAEFQVRAQDPGWIVLRIRKNTRRVKIPFRFENLSFAGEKK